MNVLFDGAPIDDGNALGVATAFLTGLGAYAARWPGECALALPEGARDPRIDGVLVITTPRGALARQIALPRLVRRLGADVLHSPVSAVPLACTKPCIATLHDVPWLDRDSCETRPWRTRAAVAWSLRKASRVLTPSVFTKEAALRLRVAAKKLVVVPNATELPADAPQCEPRRGDLLILGDDRPRKNRTRVEAAIALARSRDARVPAPRFVGPPHRRVDEPEKVALLRSCRALVSMSTYEGFGLPVLEGLAHGAAVACSDIPPHREIAGDAAVFADPRDLDAMADAIVRACVDDGLRGQLRDAGLRRASQFSPSRVAESWRRLHEELTA